MMGEKSIGNNSKKSAIFRATRRLGVRINLERSPMTPASDPPRICLNPYVRAFADSAKFMNTAAHLHSGAK